MFSQKFIFIFIFEYPLRIISELIKIPVDMLVKYYTDGFDVDEDMITILDFGGNSRDGSWIGITYRYLYFNPSAWDTGVASSNVQNIELCGFA